MAEDVDMIVEFVKKYLLCRNSVKWLLVSVSLLNYATAQGFLEVKNFVTWLQG